MGQRANWFEVDPDGLRQLLARKDPAFLLYEILQNAWDEKSTRVEVTILEGAPGTGFRVADDNAGGFRNLDEAHTLFAPSAKKGDPEKRGRFNLGEKLVLACCAEARITSTTGRVVFNDHGRRRYRVTRPAGTEFEAWLKPGIATGPQLREGARRVIPPVATTVDGVSIVAPAVIGRIRARLPTVAANSTGELVTRERTTALTLHEGGDGWLFEMGIPVCPCGTPFHINVHQKIPLGFDRDSTRESYLVAVRAAGLECVVGADRLADAEAGEAWVTRALEHPHCSTGTAKRVLELRFGEKRVAYDPSDPEANKRAVAAGYTVLAGGVFGGVAWAKIREAAAAVPAGKLFPTPKPYSPDGKPLVYIPREDWQPREVAAIGAMAAIAMALVGHQVLVRLVDDQGWGFRATYGPGDLVLNRAKIGPANLRTPLNVEILDLLLHELGHEKSGDHLSEDYYRALTHYGASLGLLLRERPNLIL